MLNVTNLSAVSNLWFVYCSTKCWRGAKRGGGAKKGGGRASFSGGGGGGGGGTGNVTPLNSFINKVALHDC